MGLSPTEIEVGPGFLFAAPVGTRIPTTTTELLSPSFRSLGYTEAGSVLKTTMASDAVYIPSEYDPVYHHVVTRETSVAFSMAQFSTENLALVMNMGTTAPTYDGITVLEPPGVGEDQTVMLALASLERLWIFRECLNLADQQANFVKDKYSMLPVEFKLRKPQLEKTFSVLSWHGDMDLLTTIIDAEIGSDEWLIALTNSSGFSFTLVSRDSNGAITTGNITWPDGTTGIFTTTVASSSFFGAIDAFTVTYNGTPVKTVTQSLVTRNAIGRVIAQPQPTVS